MGKFYLLNVYNAARKLYQSLKVNTGKMPRDDRYTHVLPMLRSVEKIMSCIAEANDEDVKTEILTPAIERVSAIQITVRNLVELNLLTKKGFSRISDNSEALKRQLKGWSKKHDGKGTGH